jgi:hypothetical protein
MTPLRIMRLANGENLPLRMNRRVRPTWIRAAGHGVETRRALSDAHGFCHRPSCHHEAQVAVPLAVKHGVTV